MPKPPPLSWGMLLSREEEGRWGLLALAASDIAQDARAAEVRKAPHSKHKLLVCPDNSVLRYALKVPENQRAGGETQW